MSTPHARGSTLRLAGKLQNELVYPACAGIHHVKAVISASLYSLPRMRGDPPFEEGQVVAERSLPRMRGDPPPLLIVNGYPMRSTPHARGSTPTAHRKWVSHAVYPACAGIHPSYLAIKKSNYRLPRMRGDPPSTSSINLSRSSSTPHARGSTRYAHDVWRISQVYPACAGIHPRR